MQNIFKSKMGKNVVCPLKLRFSSFLMEKNLITNKSASKNEDTFSVA